MRFLTSVGCLKHRPISVQYQLEPNSNGVCAAMSNIVRSHDKQQHRCQCSRHADTATALP